MTTPLPPQYPADFPIDQVLQRTPVAYVWLPTYPKLDNIHVLYVFYKPVENRVLYVGKTDKLRQRARWHLAGNTFTSAQWDTLWLDVLTINREYDAAGTSLLPMVHYEAILIRHWLPPFNANVKKTYKRTL